jgi:hypothetical protein
MKLVIQWDLITITGSSGNSVMNLYVPDTNFMDSQNYHPTIVKPCDISSIGLTMQCTTPTPAPTPTTTPTPTPMPGSCQGPSGASCVFSPDGSNYCPDPRFPVSAAPPCCCFYSPIVIDINGNGFDLTDAAGGIRFDCKRARCVCAGWLVACKFR